MNTENEQCPARDFLGDRYYTDFVDCGETNKDLANILVDDIKLLSTARVNDGLSPITMVSIPGSYDYISFTVDLPNYPENIEALSREIEAYGLGGEANPINLGRIEILLDYRLRPFARPSDEVSLAWAERMDGYFHPNILDYQTDGEAPSVCLGNYSTLMHLLSESLSFIPVYDTIMTVVSNYGNPPYFGLRHFTHGQPCKNCKRIVLPNDTMKAYVDEKLQLEPVDACSCCVWTSCISGKAYVESVPYLETIEGYMTNYESKLPSVTCSRCGRRILEEAKDELTKMLDDKIHCLRCICRCEFPGEEHYFDPGRIRKVYFYDQEFCAEHCLRTIDGNHIPRHRVVHAENPVTSEDRFRHSIDISDELFKEMLAATFIQGDKRYVLTECGHGVHEAAEQDGLANREDACLTAQE